MKYCLILSYDDDAILRCTSLLLESAKRWYPDFFSIWNVVLVHPSCFRREELDHLRTEYPLAVNSVNFLPPKNRYNLKISVYRFVVENCSADDEILYLDYDHIFFRKLRLPDISSGKIYLSSETKRLHKVGVVEKYVVQRLNDCHYNNSLIYCTAGTMEGLMEKYAALHDRYDRELPARYSEEIVFSLAGADAELSILAVARETQGYVGSNCACDAYHYGGDSVVSKKSKALALAGGSLDDLVTLVSIHEINTTAS